MGDWDAVKTLESPSDIRPMESAKNVSVRKRDRSVPFLPLDVARRFLDRGDSYCAARGTSIDCVDEHTDNSVPGVRGMGESGVCAIGDWTFELSLSSCDF